MLREIWLALGALWRVWLAVVAIIFVACMLVEVFALVRWISPMFP